MIFSGVRLPDEVSIALEEGRLVVFAGAGISVPPPSNLPLFNGLASQIWSGKPVEPRHEDRLLGKLARDGTDVHAAAARILYNEDTQPTQLHGEILRLFGTPEKVRVVTTNFDDHFSAAGRKIFGKELLREFYAPALPLGDDFEGLVYIHGSARFNPRTLILTDKDFGAAYLTRGWARDFLVPLFSKYTVLFIGYSHSDVTTTYLARGLNQAEIKPRWTMVPSDIEPQGRDDWAHLEISIAEYPIDPANTLKRPHAFLHVLLFTLMTAAVTCAEDTAKKVDFCVYGATPAGIVAAVAARQEGCTVLVIEPSRWLGGILGAGIKPMQDCAEPKAVGGLTARGERSRFLKLALWNYTGHS